MSTISMKAADNAYAANHPSLTDDLKKHLQSNMLTLEMSTN